MAANNPGGSPLRNTGDRRVTKEQLKRVSMSFPKDYIESLIKKFKITHEECKKILKEHLDVFLVGYLTVWYNNEGGCRSSLEKALRDSGTPDGIVNKFRRETGDDEALSHEQLESLSRDLPEEHIEPLLLELKFTPDQEKQVLEKNSNRMILLKIITVWWNKKEACRFSLENAIGTVLSGSDVAGPILNILSTECGGNVTERQLEKIAKDFPATKYIPFSRELGYSGNYATSVRMKWSTDTHAATLEILMSWRDRTGGPCMNLEAALILSEAYSVINIINKRS